MKCTVLIIFALSGFLATAQTNGAAVSVTTVQEGYVKAISLQKQGDARGAIEQVAHCIVMNPSDQQLLARCELLSAVLYMDLGMTNAAAVTLRQVQFFYEGTEVAEKAKALNLKIEQEQVTGTEQIEQKASASTKKQ